MQLPLLKPVIVSHKSSAVNLKSDIAFVVIDENDLEQGQIKCHQLEQLNKDFKNTLAQLVSFGDFEGKWLQTSSSLTLGQDVSKRIVLVGAGKSKSHPCARARQLGIKIAECALLAKASEMLIFASSSLLSTKELIAQCRVGLSQGVYQYPNLNITEKDLAELEKPLSCYFITEISGVSQILERTEPLVESINFCRLLQDGPPNVVTPQYVASHAAQKAQQLGLKVDICGVQKLRELGFHAMLAVASGSAQEPQFVVMEYKPQSYTKTLAFVGKGLTMDTGGYSLKTPSTHQEGMKYDMSGAAVALSSLFAIAKLNVPVHVYAVAALCENMVDAHAYRVGDVLKSYSGKTIEVLNTDAEGRIVLSDALSYTANHLKPNYIVEFSTLTGAMIVTLGHVGAGVFAFDQDLERIVMEASVLSGERAHALPVWEEVAQDTKGVFTDVKNVGAPGQAGSMVAAAFLKEFVQEVPFAHIDIAGVADGNTALGYNRKGGSGYGVQLAVSIAQLLGESSKSVGNTE
jgi:leucyl aminopeptidase